MRVGDSLVVERASGATYVYKITSTDVVDSRYDSLELDTTDKVLSLVTCYPFDAIEPGGPLRYVVTARVF